MLKVIPLGVSSGVPTLDRHVTSFAIAMEGRWISFDCGEGTQYQILKSPLKLQQLDAIFITHLHADHLLGLPGLLSTLGLQGREDPLSVYAPPGIQDFLNTIHRVTSSHSAYPLEVIEVMPGMIKKGIGYSVQCLPLHHRVLDYGYLFVEDDKPGKLDVEKIQALGIPPGPIYGELREGKKVQLPDGRWVDGSQYVGEKRRGRRIAYCSDTRPCQNAVELARGADLLIHEATYTEDLASKADEYGHSTSAQAAQIAKQAQVKRLLITHYSPRYTDVTPLLAEARKVFPNTEAAVELEEVQVV